MIIKHYQANIFCKLETNVDVYWILVDSWEAYDITDREKWCDIMLGYDITLKQEDLSERL